MIESFNRDPFDAVFFFEEEFDKINPMLATNPVKKSMISDIVKYFYKNTVDVSDIQIRETSIWSSKFEEEKAMTLPLYKVYFVSNFCPIEKLIESKMRVKSMILFPSTDTQEGSIIILEDLLKYFFRGKMYVEFDENCNKMKIEDPNEIKLLAIQLSLVIDFASFFDRFYIDHIESYDNITRYTNPLEIKSLLEIGEYLSIIDFPELIILTSLRRWINQSANHLMGSSEFDNKFMIPFISTYLYNKIDGWHNRIDWNNPKLVKVLSTAVLEMMKVLESHKIRTLSLVQRYIEFYNALDTMSFSDIISQQELEGIIQNAIYEKLPQGVRIMPC